MVTGGHGSQPASATADLAAPEGVPRALGDLGRGARDRRRDRGDGRALAQALEPSADDSAVSTWPAGARPAPAFTLTDEHGKSFSLASLHGRSAIVTFIDPLCRDFCPREASILTEAAAKLGAKAPAIVSVSVDPWADTATNFKADAAHWKLGPTWRWGTGTYAELARVWKPYDVGVEVTNKTIAGVKVRYITHTGAAYLIDRERGRARALPLPVHDRPGRLAPRRRLTRADRKR